MYVQVSFLALIGLIGLPGNFIVIAVYSKKTLTTSTIIFILALAAVDFTFCITVPIYIYHTVTKFTSPNLTLCRIFYFSAYFAVYASILLCVAIAVDRYFAVTRPLGRIITAAKARILAVICIVLSALIHVLNTLRVSMNVNYNSVLSSTNETYSTEECDTTSSTETSRSLTKLYGVSYLFWVVIITILYIRIWVVLRKRRKIRHRPTGIGTHSTPPQESEISDSLNIRVSLTTKRHAPSKLLNVGSHNDAKRLRA